MARILVVDPDAPVRALTRRILVMDGHEVVDVGQGTAVLDMLGAGPFDLMIIDVALPDIDGYELIELVRTHARGADLPIIVATESDDSNDIIRGAAAGVLDHLRKPVSFTTLQAAVGQVLNADARAVRERRLARTDAADLYRTTIDLTEQARQAI